VLFTLFSLKEGMTLRAKLKPFALILIVLLSVVLAAANYVVMTQAPFGSCAIGSVTLIGADLGEYKSLGCLNYMYYFVGAPLVVGLLLLLILPSLVTREETAQEAKPASAQPETRKAAPPPPKPTSDAAVQLLALFQREGRLVDFLREDI